MENFSEDVYEEGMNQVYCKALGGESVGYAPIDVESLEKKEQCGCPHHYDYVFVGGNGFGQAGSDNGDCNKQEKHYGE